MANSHNHKASLHKYAYSKIVMLVYSSHRLLFLQSAVRLLHMTLNSFAEACSPMMQQKSCPRHFFEVTPHHSQTRWFLSGHSYKNEYSAIHNNTLPVLALHEQPLGASRLCSVCGQVHRMCAPATAAEWYEVVESS